MDETDALLSLFAANGTTLQEYNSSDDVTLEEKRNNEGAQDDDEDEERAVTGEEARSRSIQNSQSVVTIDTDTTTNDVTVSGKNTAAAAAAAQKKKKTTTKQQWQLLLSMGLTLPYLGLVISLLLANNYDQDTVIEANYFLSFHMYEFWGSVYFSLVEAYILLVVVATTVDDQEDNNNNFSTIIMDYSSSNNQKSVMIHLLSLNIVASMVAASLFSLCPEIFEVPSHYIEYASQISVTLLDSFFMILPRNGGGGGKYNTTTTKTTRCDDGGNNNKTTTTMNLPLKVQQGYFVLLLIADFVKFFLYAEIIPTSIGNERSSHYVEFVGEILNSLWAFWYVKDLYMKTLLME